jgi:hypothetical protein
MVTGISRFEVRDGYEDTGSKEPRIVSYLRIPTEPYPYRIRIVSPYPYLEDRT